MDITSVPKLDAALRRAEERAKVVVRGLQALELIDSSGARVIVRRTVGYDEAALVT